MTDTAKKAEKKGDLVFISYAGPDRDIADRIYSGLRLKGIQGWVAHRDIDGGRDWTDEISKAISQSGIFIAVISSNTENSPYVKDEATLAKVENKMIIPFYIENVSLQGGLKLLLSNCQWINAFPGPQKKYLDQLVETVLGYLGKAPVRKEGKKIKKSLLQKPILIAVSIIILLTAAVFLINPLVKKEVTNTAEPQKKTVEPEDPIPDPPPISEINRQHVEVNPLNYR
jgi:hypothetical protein